MVGRRCPVGMMDPAVEKELGLSPSSQNLLPRNDSEEGMKNKIITRTGLQSKTLDGIRRELGIHQEVKKDDELILNQGTSNEIKIWGYKENVFKKILTTLAMLPTFGFLSLVLYWVEKWRLYATCERCPLSEATKVLIMDYYKGIHKTLYVKNMKIIKTTVSPDTIYKNSNTEKQEVKKILRFFNFKKRKYIWDTDTATFNSMRGMDDAGLTLGDMQEYAFCGGITEAVATLRRILYGENEIEVPVTSIPVLMVKEILSPFYVFQVFSICLWYADGYWLYATAIMVTSIVSLSAALYNTRTNQQNLRDTIVSSEAVSVFRPAGAEGVNPSDVNPSTMQDMMSTQLVPGDVIKIPDHGCQMHCDAVLLEGQAIMNESMLTGESVPVTKTACPNDETAVYDAKVHEKHTLKCGTEVIQTRKVKGQTVKALVIRTGYLTTKGDLVRSILYPPPVDFQFEKDSYMFILFLAAMATIGMIYTFIKMVLDGETWVDIVLSVFDLITIVVPPALPAAMTIGVVIAQRRLRKKGIYCISPRTINVSGSIDCVCFDKTGTITEDGMDMWGVMPSGKGIESVLPRLGNVDIKEEDAGNTIPIMLEPVKKVSELSMESEIRVGMAVCHELNIIEGEIKGDPLEEKIFEFTGWRLEQEGDDQSQMDKFVMPYVRSPKDSKTGAYIQAAPARVCEFSSDTQCMSVICRVFREHEQSGEFSQPECIIYSKGSPEKMRRLCRPETIPDNFAVILDEYASQGYRILALASRRIPPAAAKNVKLTKLERADIECDLTFLGLIIMENRIKAVSSDVITELHGANIRPIMVTGDNILTAISVSRNCGLVKPGIKLIRVTATLENEQNDNPSVEFTELDDHVPSKAAKLEMDEAGKPEHSQIDMGGNAYYFVLDGAAFETIATYYKDDLLPYIAARGAVFARMRPHMKQQLVEILQELDYFVTMCGDGANDCGALKAAHAGISLSEAEASVASPFTSKIPDISCVPQLVREGRTALVTSFGIFKYMAGYSITQYLSVMVLYDIYSNLSDTQYLYIDMFVITTLAAFFGLNRSHTGRLAKSPPQNSLISFLPLFSLVSQLMVVVAFQVVALKLVEGQPWYVPFDYKNPCYLNTTVEDAFAATNLNTIDEYCDPEADIDPVASYENYAVFSVSQFQYIILAIAFSKGRPYRSSMITNIPFMATIVVLTSFSVYLVLDPAKVLIYEFIIGFHLFLPPADQFSFRLLLLGLAAANLVISLFFENMLVDRCLKKKVELIKKGVKKHEKLERDLEKRKDWPKLTGPQAAISPNKNGSQPGSAGSKDHQVIITDQGVSDANQALNSLFSTPASICHETAAVFLNPPPYSPKLQQQKHQLPNQQELGGGSAALNLFQSSSTADSTPMHTTANNNADSNKFDSALSSPVRNLSALSSPVTLTDGVSTAGLEVSDSSSDCNSKFVSCNSVLIDAEATHHLAAENLTNGDLNTSATAGVYKPVSEPVAYNPNLGTEPGAKKTCSNSPIPYR